MSERLKNVKQGKNNRRKKLKQNFEAYIASKKAKLSDVLIPESTV
jgi:hypothetical protein